MAEQADRDVARGLLLLRLHLHFIERLQQKGAHARAAARRLHSLFDMQRLAVPALKGELQLLLTKLNAQRGAGRLPLRKIPAACGNIQHIIAAKQRRLGLDAWIAALAFENNVEARKIDLQRRGRAMFAGKANLPDCRRAFN